MKIHYILITVLLVGVVVTGALNFMVEVGENYDVLDDAELGFVNKTINATEKTQKEAMDLSNTITDLTQEDSGVFDTPYKLIKMGISSAKLMFLSWETVSIMIGSATTGISGILGVDIGWYAGIVIAIIVITVVVILIYAFLKWKLED